MHGKICLLVFIFSFISLTAFANPKHEEQYEQARTMMVEGSKTFNVEQLNRSREIFIFLFRNSYHDYQTAYDIAYIDNKLIDVYLDQHNSSKASFYIEEALHYLDESIKLNDKYSDAFCLLAGILGQKIILKGIPAGILYQSKTAEALRKAKEIDPNNPDVYLGLGITAVATPKFFGGNLEKGIDLLNKTLELDPKKYRAYVWLSKAYRSKGEMTLAKNMILEALRHNPYDLGAKKELATLTN